MSSSFFAALYSAFGRYDVVHIHAEGPAFFCWIPKLFGKRVISTIHGLDWAREKWRGSVAAKFIRGGEKNAVKYADEIIVLSKGVQKYFMDTYGRETHFIPNGVNRPEVREAKLITDNFGLEKDSYILFLGRLVPEKGIRYLVEAFKNVKTDKKLVIAGGASDTDSFMEELKELAKGDDRILFTGFVQGAMLDELYSNAYIYTLPSDLEGMPLSLLEAMSYGNCCLVSDIPECTEVVEDNGEVEDNIVDEQGKLVAEDLWNGFDEDFQEAVQKYLSEKWNMPKKEDVVSEIIEKAVPVPDNSAQDYSDVPVYYEPFSYAKENDEVDLYRTSCRLNSECKQAIHEAIADNYDGMYLGDGVVDQVVRQYGMERVGYILANTLHHKSYDGRFSRGNKEWAEQVSTPEHNADRMTFRTDWVVDSHPAILDGFVTMFREELEAQKTREQPFVKQFYVVENLQAAPLKIERFGNLDDAMSQYQALPNHYMKALGVEKNPDPLPGSLDILQCRNGIDTIVEDYKTVPGWDNPYIQNHVVQPLQGALAVQDVELAYELPDAYFHIQTCDDGFDYTLYNKDFTERDGGILETDGDKSVQEAMTELLAEFGCDAAQGRVMDAAELREQADMVAEQQAEVLKEKLAAERPAPEETLSFYVAECLEFTFAGEFHDHLTMEEALEAYDKIPSERMNADKCIGFCIEEDGGFVGMYELVVNDKVQRENINSINYFRDDKLVQQAISDMEKLMAARQQSKEQERSNTKKSVLDALRSLKAKKQEQPAQEQDKPKKVKKKGMEL